MRPISLAYSPEFLADPCDLFSRMHDDYPPVFWSPKIGSSPATWMLLKHADCFHVLRHPELFTNVGGTPFPRDPDDHFCFIPVEIEPPHHRKYRNILDPFFSPKGVIELEEDIRTLASGLTPGSPIAAHANSPGNSAPDDRALSAIVHARFDGEPLTFKEVFGFAFFVFIAGIDTVYVTLDNAWLWLARNPDRLREIVERPENIAGLVEELHRVSTVTFPGRTATQDTEMRGITIMAGEKVLGTLPAANYDPEIFPNPREVNFNRPRTPIPAFSGGVHSCMGARPARLEMEVCLEEWLRRLPDFAVKPGAKMHFLPGVAIGPDCLPLEW